ncbi:MAG: delta-60 repeat domain-containing protein, partial [Actinomycetota bacterium]
MQAFKSVCGRLTFLFFACLIILTYCNREIRAQDGFINPDIDNTVIKTIVQPDGRILAAGSFSNVAGEPRAKVVRLNPNGSLDASFQNPAVTGPAFNENVFTMALQPDGKILIGGQFTSVGGLPRTYLARLNTDGTPDTAFAPTLNNPVVTLDLETDGKIVIGGYFSVVNGQTRTNLARLNADGSLD